MGGEKVAVVSRWMQILVAPLILLILGYIGHLITDGHDAITRIEQELADGFTQMKGELGDHEQRIRVIEASHRTEPPSP